VPVTLYLSERRDEEGSELLELLDIFVSFPSLRVLGRRPRARSTGRALSSASPRSGCLRARIRLAATSFFQTINVIAGRSSRHSARACCR